MEGRTYASTGDRFPRYRYHKDRSPSGLTAILGSGRWHLERILAALSAGAGDGAGAGAAAVEVVVAHSTAAVAAAVAFEAASGAGGTPPWVAVSSPC